MPRLIKIAIACGAMPLIAGTAIYFLWRLTRWEFLERLGMFNIFIGLALFAIGVGCVIRQSNDEMSTPNTNNGNTGQRNLLVVTLLLANFPAAIIYGLSAIEVMTRYTVCITNESPTAIEKLVLVGPNSEWSIGVVPAGARVQRELSFGGEGSLSFTAEHEGESIQGEVDGYVTGGLGGDTTLRLLPNGKFDVRRKWDTSFLARD